MTNELYLESIKFLFALLGNDSLFPLTCFYNFLFMNISTHGFQGPNPRKGGLRYKIKGKFGKKSLERTQNQYLSPSVGPELVGPPLLTLVGLAQIHDMKMYQFNRKVLR